MKKWQKVLIIVISVILAVILLLVSSFFIMSYIGKKQFHDKDTHISAEFVDIEDEDTILYNNQKYTLNKNIVSILVIGVDRDNINKDLGIGKNGQADVIFVVTIDTNTKKTTIIPISRETMVDINIYTVDGKFTGTEKQQLCLAYAYGNSPEKCSENVLTSVKRLLKDINISSYVTLELDGVGKLCDMVGGVSVTCLEDIEINNTKYKKGQTINLTGTSAITYIQHRGDDLEANDRRMQRQKQFLTALVNKAGNAVVDDITNTAKFYNTLSPYYSTNISLPQILFLVQNCLTANFGDSMIYQSIEGTLSQGEKWIEFVPNEESIVQTVLDTFYIKK